MNPSPRPLDELDRRIIVALRSDPRTQNKELAAMAGVSEATVANRISALETDNVIHVTAQRDFRAAGYEVLASVDIGVRGRPVADVARDVAAIEGVAIVTVVMGDKPLMLLVVAASLSELHQIVARQLANVPGVSSVETMIISEVLKYRSEFAALRT